MPQDKDVHLRKIFGKSETTDDIITKISIVVYLSKNYLSLDLEDVA